MVLFYLVVEAGEAVKNPTVHSNSQQRIIHSNMSIVTKLRKLALSIDYV
jgi:hypothetical protein